MAGNLNSGLSDLITSVIAFQGKRCKNESILEASYEKVAEVDLHRYTNTYKLKKSVDETAILKEIRTFSFLWIAHSSRKSKAERDFFHNQLSSELRLQFTTKTI